MAKGIAEVRAASLKAIEPWSKLPEREKPTGVPVAFPISLRAVDRNGASTIIQYFVYSDVSYDKVAPLISEALKKKEPTDDREGSDGDGDESKDEAKTGQGTVRNGPKSEGVMRDGLKLDDELDETVKLLLLALVVLIFILLVLMAFLLYKMIKKDTVVVEAEEVDGLVKVSSATVCNESIQVAEVEVVSTNI